MPCDIEREKKTILKYLSDLYICGTVPGIIIRESGEIEYQVRWRNDETKKAYADGQEYLRFLMEEAPGDIS